MPSQLDAYTVGGGEDSAQILAVEHLLADGGLHKAARAGAPVFAICAGFQLVGETFRAAGREVEGLGLIDARTVTLQKRAIGEVASQPTQAGVTSSLASPLTGFENHMGASVLGPDAHPLGAITTGIGNCDADAARAGAADDIAAQTRGWRIWCCPWHWGARWMSWNRWRSRPSSSCAPSACAKHTPRNYSRGARTLPTGQ